MEILIKVHTEFAVELRDAMSLLQSLMPVENAASTDAVVSPIPDPVPPPPPEPTGDMISHSKIMELQEAKAATDVFKADPPKYGCIPPTQAEIEAAIPPPPPPAAGVETDAAGVPWDKRIHSGAKTKIVKDNTWKMKRNVDPALRAAVLLEIAGAPAAIAPPAPPAGAIAPPPPPPPVSDMNVDFQKLMADAIAAGKTPEDCDSAARQLGLLGLVGVQKDPSKIPAIRAALGLEAA